VSSLQGGKSETPVLRSTSGVQAEYNPGRGFRYTKTIGTGRKGQEKSPFPAQNPRNRCESEVVFRVEKSSDFSGDLWPFPTEKNKNLVTTHWKIQNFSDPEYCF
jgi:hypothetical protein